MAILTRKTQTLIKWGEISAEVKAGNAANLFAVGDEITEMLTTGEDVTVVVAGIDLYNKNEVVFAFKNSLKTRYHMNSRTGNKGGYQQSDMRFYLNKEVLSTLPDSLSGVIKKRKFAHFEAALWLPSEFEIFGENVYGQKEDADKHIPYYKTPINRVKALSDDGSAYIWWERSPYCYYSTHFCAVGSIGTAGGTDASGAFGVAPCFCI
jgi:hypothetical protein